MSMSMLGCASVSAAMIPASVVAGTVASEEARPFRTHGIVVLLM